MQDVHSDIGFVKDNTETVVFQSNPLIDGVSCQGYYDGRYTMVHGLVEPVVATVEDEETRLWVTWKQSQVK